jgi:hypothetical protein
MYCLYCMYRMYCMYMLVLICIVCIACMVRIVCIVCNSQDYMYWLIIGIQFTCKSSPATSGYVWLVLHVLYVLNVLCSSGMYCL